MPDQLLTDLLTTPGVPGRELRIRNYIADQVKDLVDETHVDAMGSLHAVRKPRVKKNAKKPKHPTRVMVAAHMDQIGFLVRHIDDKGFLRLQNVGGFDTRNLFARLVTVSPKLDDPGHDLVGVMNPGGKPVHIAGEDEKKKIPEVSDLIVDLGLDADTVKDRVKIGDMVTIHASPREVGQTVVSQAIDNRIACWIAIEALKKLKQHKCEVHVVFTVQEEVGLRGATTAAHRIKPDIGIAVDTTLCCDTPGVPGDMAVTEQGKGAALTVMDSASIADLSLLEEFEAIATKKNLPHQRSILPRGGTDAGALQRAADGVRAFTLSCPTRYIHTVTEMVHKTEMNACRDLLAAFLAQVK